MVELIVLFVIFIIALILNIYNADGAVELYSKCGGYTPPGEVDPEKIKKFFTVKKYRNLLQEMLNNDNKPLQYYTDIKQEIKYESDSEVVKSSTHIGQLKLFLTELEFLTEMLTSHLDNSIVIYAGSAPSNKIYFLHILFPNVKFIMVDPNEHLILFPDGNHYVSAMAKNVVYLDCKNKGNKYNIKNRMINFYKNNSVQLIKKELAENNILKEENLLNFIETSNYNFYIIEDLFTNQLADLFTKLKCYFISDIRSNINEMIPFLKKINEEVKNPVDIHGEEFPSDLDTCWNAALHLNWLQRLRPKAAMLKYKVPWFLQSVEEFNYYAKLAPYAEDFAEAKKRGVDFIEDYKNKKHTFLANDKIYIQAFPGIASTETRLIATNYDNFADYDGEKYDGVFYYYNWFYRSFAFIDHGYMDKNLGIDGCNDCALMVKIFRDYAYKYKLPDKPKENIAMLLKIIHRTLKTGLHGHFHKPYKSIDEIINKQLYYIKNS